MVWGASWLLNLPSHSRTLCVNVLANGGMLCESEGQQAGAGQGLIQQHNQGNKGR